MTIENKKHLLEMKREYGFEALPETLGGRVPITNMLREVKTGRLTAEKLKDQIENLIYNLLAAKEQALKILEKCNECKHLNYKPATYTFQSRIIGFMYCYKRVCADCGHIDSASKHTDDVDCVLPDWTVGAKEQYFNNSY